MAASFLNPLLKASERLELRNLRTGRLVATHVRTAFDSVQRRRGLLSSNGLEPGEVLIIAPSNAVHTFFMRFPLDLAFVARDGRIVKIRADVPAWRMAGSLSAFAVIEAAAGSFARADCRVGDRLGFAQPGEELPVLGR